MTDQPDATTDAERTTAAAESSLEAPEVIGPYRILQKIGEGGMGDVYLAEQTAPVRRRVALKTIKHGMDTKQVVARFESERQALAMMDHPYIAKVFDAGATDSGRPYFVMEYVQGIPITEHCDRHRLSVRQRLELFRRVCEGVQHAHQKAIIHRDIKPSNILVVIRDDEAVPKIIDFGVAKATAQRLTEHTVFTELGQLIGTPEYMSPEQAEMSQQDIDTRTDVYALGVVLYELLVGALPFDAGELRAAGLFEIHRRIRSEEPAKPSTRVSSLGDASIAAAAQRQTDPLRLVGQLRGDLDWITMKAMEKERSRRYGSPADLSADIGRYLKDEAVEATPPSVTYRFGKFVRRHRVGVGVTAVVAVLLVAFGVSTVVQAARVARERDRANREAETASQVASFLTGLFEISAPSEALGNAITAREILDRGVERISGELSGQPLTQAQLMRTMGDVYARLGLYDSALPLLEKALATRRDLLGEEDEQTLVSQTDLAALQFERGRFELAERLALEAVELQERVLGADHLVTLESSHYLALAQSGQGREVEAESTLRQTLDALRRVAGEEHELTLRAMNALAAVLQNQGRFDDAARLYRDTLDIRRRNDGPVGVTTLTLIHNLASVSNQMGQYEDAESLAREALEGRRRILGDEHRYTLTTEYVLALSFFHRQLYSEVTTILIPSIEVARRTLGDQHPVTLESMNLLGEAYQRDGRYDDAEPVLRDTLELRRLALGAEHIRTQWSMYNLATLYRAQGRFDEADRLYRQTLEIELRVLGEAHPDTVDTAYQLARMEAQRGQYPEALEWLGRAVSYGLSDPSLITEEPDFAGLLDRPELVALADTLRQ